MGTNKMNGKPKDGFIYKAATNLDGDALIAFFEECGRWKQSGLSQGGEAAGIRRSMECPLTSESFADNKEQLASHLQHIRDEVRDHLRHYLKPYRAFCEVNVDEGWRCLRYEKKGHYKPHSDGDTGVLTRRVSAIIYLNDDYVGGKLHFPFQNVTIQPEKNEIVLFPSGFTHVHAAQPVEKGTKYCLVSWLSYANN